MGQLKHILVVDDDGDVRDVLVEILQNDNYRVSSVANGALMRDFLETDDAVDCVVLDALMPGESSISLAHHLKEVGIPLVMISGSHMEYAEKNGLQLLRIPFHTQELYSALNRRSPSVSSDSGTRDRRGDRHNCADWKASEYNSGYVFNDRLLGKGRHTDGDWEYSGRDDPVPPNNVVQPAITLLL